MFASDAPMGDQTMVVDAVTVDGRHVDPYSEATSRYPNPGRAEIPDRLDNDSFVFNYSGRIPGSGSYHQALTNGSSPTTSAPGTRRTASSASTPSRSTTTARPSASCKPRNIRSHVFLSHPPKR